MILYKKILDEQCELAKRMPLQTVLVAGKGLLQWHGYHSQNFTFHIRDYTRGSILYYQHLCQRGGDLKNELYQGTSKSCEGYARFSRKCMKRECLLLRTGKMLIQPLQERSKSILSLVK